MQYVVTAYDYTDASALDRRLAMRDKHLAGLAALRETGNFISGGAIVDDSGKMIGSSAHVEFVDQDALNQWLDNDPYVTGNVWEHIEVKAIKLFAG